MGKVCHFCKKIFEKNNSRSFHIFPRDLDLRKSWFQAIGQKYIKTTYIHLCSDHFALESFCILPKGRRTLKRGAIPLIVNNENADKREESGINDKRTRMMKNARSLSCTSSTSSSSVKKKFQTNEEIPGLLQMSYMDTPEAISSPSPMEEIIIIIDVPGVDSQEQCTSSLEEEQAYIVEDTKMLEKLISDWDTPAMDAQQECVKLVEEAKTENLLSSNSGSQLECNAAKPKAKRTKPRYIGDVDESYFTTPSDVKSVFELTNEVMERYNKELKELIQINMRLKAKKNFLQSLTLQS